MDTEVLTQEMIPSGQGFEIHWPGYWESLHCCFLSCIFSAATGHYFYSFHLYLIDLCTLKAFKIRPLVLLQGCIHVMGVTQVQKTIGSLTPGSFTLQNVGVVTEF
ncbi:leucine-rich repeat-containing protein 16B [Platysternon megacephalum]|uniref:Leucine-rich repeat-containing protein 16B n=1 Tax=Platysternon megacephalum TaxID=55544 RepID=A0A4D9DU56_9SAUR|nr:leucine-rich repeat-containing protein 16B [Platysternon megacephalum]